MVNLNDHRVVVAHLMLMNELMSELLTTAQLAERWQCCAHTIRRRTDLKPVRLSSRTIRYRLEDVLEKERELSQADYNASPSRTTN